MNALNMNIAILIGSIAIVSSACNENTEMPKNENLKYPKTRKVDTIDSYFGTSVSDPYRWLENDTAAETEAWVKAQNKLTESYMQTIPFRQDVKDQLTGLFDYARVGTPIQIGDLLFFSKNDGLQNQAVIYYRKADEKEARVFIDPNKLSADGTVSINLLGASKDHKYIAYAQSEAGSDWSVIRIREIATNTLLDDKLEWVKFSDASWKADGFYYSRYPEPEKGTELSGDNKYHSIYFHKVGTDQSSDELFYRNDAKPNLYHYGNVTEDEKYFVIYAAEGTDGFETFMKPLGSDKDLTKICAGFANKTTVIDHKNGLFYCLTDVDAPNYRLVSFAPQAAAQKNWKDVLPEQGSVLVGVATGGGFLFPEYLENVVSKIEQRSYDGSLIREIKLPAPGSVGGLSGTREKPKLYYSFTSFTYPAVVYEYDLATGESTPFTKPELKFTPEDYETKQVRYASKDGTEIPMFIVHRKGIELNGSNPTLLYGYGGFNISLSPSFSPSILLFLAQGGIYALANLRGGGEFGESWHKQGMKSEKQNVFDDFIAAAEYLIEQRYTRSSSLAIRGGSNGGLLVGAAMTQRPDLFAVALPAVGVMDMLRFQKFTVGKGWVPEYGSADSSKAEFETLYAYSPLHNLKVGASYPSTLITTGDHDDRVVPAHSFKFAATLQETHRGQDPVLIRIETDGGHGAGKPVSKVIDEQADIWAFTLYQLGVRSLKVEPEEALK